VPYLNIYWYVEQKGKKCGERREGDKSAKGINERKKECEILRSERGHSPLNFNGIFTFIYES
jgi:hypothetical protein